MSKSSIKQKVSSEESLLTRLRQQRQIIKRSTLPTQENQENLIKIRTDPTVKDTRLYVNKKILGSNTYQEKDLFQVIYHDISKNRIGKTLNNTRSEDRKFTQQPRKIIHKFVRNRNKSKTERINNIHNFEEKLEELLKNKGNHTECSYLPSEITEKNDSPPEHNENTIEEIENKNIAREILINELLSKQKQLIDPQKLSYEIVKNYSQIKIGRDADFIERMQFDVYKRQSKEQRMKLLIERHKPKIDESVRVEAFNRLIKDANRRIEVQENMNQLKLSLENQERDYASPKAYKSEEWDNIYQKRFHKFDEKRKEKIEKIKKEQESIKLMEEEKIINHGNKKKLTSENLKETFERLYKHAEVLKIKHENKLREIEEEKRITEIKESTNLHKNKQKKFLHSKKIIKENSSYEGNFNISAEITSPKLKGQIKSKLKNDGNHQIIKEEHTRKNQTSFKEIKWNLKNNVDRIVSLSKVLETSCNSNNDERINLKELRKIHLKNSPGKKQQCNLKYKYLSENQAKKFMDNLFSTDY